MKNGNSSHWTLNFFMSIITNKNCNKQAILHGENDMLRIADNK